MTNCNIMIAVTTNLETTRALYSFLLNSLVLFRALSHGRLLVVSGGHKKLPPQKNGSNKKLSIGSPFARATKC